MCPHNIAMNYSYLSHRNGNICLFIKWNYNEPDSVAGLRDTSQITEAVQN